jgi:hypothetical protein
MNSITQHVLPYIEGVEPKKAEFDSLEQLLEVDWVKSWKDRQGFHRFSVNKNKLMAEYMQGRLWYVVGFIKEPIEGLPTWK